MCCSMPCSLLAETNVVEEIVGATRETPRDHVKDEHQLAAATRSARACSSTQIVPVLPLSSTLSPS